MGEGEGERGEREGKERERRTESGSGARVRGWEDPTGWDSVVTEWSGSTLGGATVFLMGGGAEEGSPERSFSFRKQSSCLSGGAAVLRISSSRSIP